MKKLLVVLPLAVLLLALTFSWAGAGMDFEDPKLCVEGKWLVVDAAHPTSVTVFLPEDAKYGNQKQGGCATRGPDVPLITVVKERGEQHRMRVRVEGKQASQPNVTVLYGAATQVKPNDGHGALNFTFLVK